MTYPAPGVVRAVGFLASHQAAAQSMRPRDARWDSCHGRWRGAETTQMKDRLPPDGPNCDSVLCAIELSCCATGRQPRRDWDVSKKGLGWGLEGGTARTFFKRLPGSLEMNCERACRRHGVVVVSESRRDESQNAACPGPFWPLCPSLPPLRPCPSGTMFVSSPPLMPLHCRLLTRTAGGLGKRHRD